MSQASCQQESQKLSYSKQEVGAQLVQPPDKLSAAAAPSSPPPAFQLLLRSLGEGLVDEVPLLGLLRTQGRGRTSVHHPCLCWRPRENDPDQPSKKDSLRESGVEPGGRGLGAGGLGEEDELFQVPGRGSGK